MLIHTSKSRALQRRHPGHLIEIDYSSPLARGLEVLIDSGSLSDLVHRQKCNVSGISVGVGVRGPSARTLGLDTTSGIFGTVNSTIGSGPMTEFCFVANANRVGASYQYVCGSYSATAVGMAIEYSSAGGSWGVFDNGTPLFASDVLQTGLEYFLVHTRDGNTHRLYRNGGLKRSVTAGNTTIPAIPFNQNTLASAGTAWSSQSSIYYSGRYRRPLDQAEVIDLYNYPWAWARKLPQIFAVTSGGSLQTLTPSLYTNSQTFYSPTLGTSNTLSPNLYTNTSTFFTTEVSTNNTLLPSLFSNTQVFYSPTLIPSIVSLLPDLFVGINYCYAPTVTLAGGVQYIAPDVYNNGQQFYSATIFPGSVTLVVPIFDNTNTFYIPLVSQGSALQELVVNLLTNINEFYTPNVSVGAVSLLIPLYENAQVFYSPTVAFVTPPVSGEVTLSAQTIADLATAIANAIYAHPEALTASGIADAVMLEIDARGYLTTHKYIALK